MDTRKTLFGVVAVLMVGAIGWALGLFGGTDPVVAEVQQMRDQLFAGRDLPDGERQQLRDQFRERLRSLSDEQRRALFESGRAEWMQRAEQRMDEFFALSPREQQQRLDDLIARMLERRNQPRQSPVSGNANVQRRGERGRNLSEAQRDGWRKRQLDRSTPKQRAQREEFRRRLRERMEQRGLDPDSLPGRGGWGRRGTA